MSITLYGIANCDTVKKTKKLLKANGTEFEFYDFKKQEPTEAMLKRWIKEFGAELVINKRGTTWRKLDESEQAKAEQGQKQQVELLLANTSMIKRPIIEAKGKKNPLIGFNKEAIEDFIQ